MLLRSHFILQLFVVVLSFRTCSAATFTLNNGLVLATFNASGLVNVSASAPGVLSPRVNLTTKIDAWSATLMAEDPSTQGFTPLAISSSACGLTWFGIAPSNTTATVVRGVPQPMASSSKGMLYTWTCSGDQTTSSGFRVDVVYELRANASFLIKELRVASLRPWSGIAGDFLVQNVNYTVELASAMSSVNAPPEWAVQANGFNDGLQIAGFARFSAINAGVFATVTNPFTQYTGVPQGQPCQQGTNHVNDDMPGSPFYVATPLDCQHACEQTEGCVGYVFLPPGCEHHTANACFLKDKVTPVIQEACACLGTKPFHNASEGSGIVIGAAYEANIWHNSTAPTEQHVADAFIIGATALEKYSWPESGLNYGERKAIATCADAFMMDKASRAKNGVVKVNVAWDENDFQIDVATDDGVTEYKRIIDRNAQFGSTHIVYEPRNTHHSSRFNTTDGWGWEEALWFSLGEQIRQGLWRPKYDPVPQDILDMISYARQKNVSLMAYVYPCLAFEAVPSALDGSSFNKADLANMEFQNYMLETLCDFVDVTSAGGFAWDHDIFTGDPAKRYAQWRAWMRIIETLRQRHPDIVMDHRQTNHMWGPWYQLAGSYAEPIAGDENPETYGVDIASLSTDHVSADHLRSINYRYSVQQSLPASRVPGFVFHQSERTADNGTSPCFGNEKLCYDNNVRDFDYMGYRYSLLSTIASAGLNVVLTMIPARDVQEFTQLPTKDIDFVRSWLSWADDNQQYLANAQPIAPLGPPSVGSADGWSAMQDEQGYVFLFNPGPAALNVTITADESIGLSNSSTGTTLAVSSLYPHNGPLVMVKYGGNLTISMFGSSCNVLQFQPQSPFSPATHMTKHINVAAAAGTGAGRRFMTQLDTVTQPVVVNGVLCKHVSQAQAHSHLQSQGPIAAKVDVQFEMLTRSTFTSSAFPPPPAGFAGGWYNTSFTITPDMKAQLQQRQATYNISWSKNDLDATWLVPTRLLINPYIVKPSDSMDLQLLIDDKPVALSKSYNSRGRVVPKCFLGFFYDVSSLNAGTRHTLALKLPKLDAGQFQGVFWFNIVNEGSNDDGGGGGVDCGVGGEARAVLWAERSGDGGHDQQDLAVVRRCSVGLV